MRSLEYIYLVGAATLLGFLALSWDEMPNGPRIGIFAGIVICAFMYSFRRGMRIKMEQAQRDMEARDQEEEKENDA